MINYSLIDQPEVLSWFFYPRKDYTPCPKNAFDLAIPVDQNISVTCRFFLSDGKLPWVLYFHGNGEIASDYDDIAPLYHEVGLNLVVADYRGYGASQGYPTFTNMVKDAHRLFQAIREELAEKNLTNDMYVMGRSLGSIPALELAYGYPDLLRGVIIESGFTSFVHMIRHLELIRGDTETFNNKCIEMVTKIIIPALIIHGEYDQLVSLKQGMFLFRNLGSSQKSMLVIPGADHNDILYYGQEKYFQVIREFVETT
jgi:Putative lysophospholipase.